MNKETGMFCTFCETDVVGTVEGWYECSCSAFLLSVFVSFPEHWTTPDPNDAVAIGLILGDRITKLEAENQRLREALEVYANHDNWDVAGWWSEPIIWNWADKGYDLAEKTLKEVSKK